MKKFWSFCFLYMLYVKLEIYPICSSSGFSWVFFCAWRNRRTEIERSRRHCIVVAVNGGTVWNLSEVKSIEGMNFIVHNSVFEVSCICVVGFGPSCWIWLHSIYATWDRDLYLLFKVKSFPLSNHLASFKRKKQQQRLRLPLSQSVSMKFWSWHLDLDEVSQIHDSNLIPKFIALSFHKQFSLSISSVSFNMMLILHKKHAPTAC